MVLVRHRIYQADVLLRIPKNQINLHRSEAIKLIKLLNHYYLSPVFVFSGGLELQDDLIKKYDYRNRITIYDKFMNILTALFCDEIIIGFVFICATLFMSTMWLANCRQAAYKNGYNHINGVDDYGHIMAWYYARYDKDYRQCTLCNQEIVSYSDENYTYQFSIEENHCCANIPTTYCPLVNISGIEVAKNAFMSQKQFCVDPNSFVNDTYITYMHYPKPHCKDWYAIICNRTAQAEYWSDREKPYCDAIFLGRLFLLIMFYVMVNYVI